MKLLALLLGFVALLTACASERSFYSFLSRDFVPLAETPVREDLVATWRSSDGRQLDMRPDGKFSMGSSGGCWDVDGNKLVLRPGCVNYGAQKDSIILAFAEATHDCSFQLSGHLILRDCIYAGRYEKYTSPHRSKG